jgi:hypothetical protein
MVLGGVLAPYGVIIDTRGVMLLDRGVLIERWQNSPTDEFQEPTTAPEQLIWR